MYKRQVLPAILVETPWSTEGIGGNSLASAPFIVASTLSPLTSIPVPEDAVLTAMVCFSSEFTNSVSSLAGIVIEPSSRISLPTQVLIAISRLVADSFSLPSEALTKDRRKSPAE